MEVTKDISKLKSSKVPTETSICKHDSGREKTFSRRKLFRLYFHKASTALIWILCSGVLFLFSRQIILEYLRKSPVTVIFFVDPPTTPEPVRIKICNSVFLDAQKILGPFLLSSADLKLNRKFVSP